MNKAPFIFGSVASGGRFINRGKEILRLEQNFLAGTNTSLISPRRWGKTSLVHRVAGGLQKKHPKLKFCFIDLFNVRTEEEFYKVYFKEVLKATNDKVEESLEMAKKLFKGLMPKIKLELGDDKEFSLGLEMKETKKNPDEVIDMAEKICQKKKIKLIVCIDEFQNIGFFDDPLAFQKKLRAHWQHHRLATYCMYGSKRHMMMDIFGKVSMPFYKFGDIIFLEKIKETYWIPFIMKEFKENGKNISQQLAAKIAHLMENHPYFVQQLAQEVWYITQKTCTEKDIEAALKRLMNRYGMLYQREIDNLATSQVNFLHALCDNVEQYSSHETINSYKLGTSANVLRIKKALEDKEIIDILNKKTEFLDPLFRHWLRQIYFKA